MTHPPERTAPRDQASLLGLRPIVTQQASEADRLCAHMNTCLKAKHNGIDTNRSQVMLIYIHTRGPVEGGTHDNAFFLNEVSSLDIVLNTWQNAL